MHNPHGLPWEAVYQSLLSRILKAILGLGSSHSLDDALSTSFHNPKPSKF